MVKLITTYLKAIFPFKDCDKFEERFLLFFQISVVSTKDSVYKFYLNSSGTRSKSMGSETIKRENEVSRLLIPSSTKDIDRFNFLGLNRKVQY